MNTLPLAPLKSLPLTEALEISRALVPHRLHPLAAAALLVVWPKTSERDLLQRMQKNLTGRRVAIDPSGGGQRLPLRRIVERVAQRMDQQRRQLVRSLFADAARRQAIRYQVKRQFDMLACYAGLARPDLLVTEGIPQELIPVLGGELLDNHLGLDLHRNPDAADEYAEAIFDHLCQFGIDDLTAPDEGSHAS